MMEDDTDLSHLADEAAPLINLGPLPTFPGYLFRQAHIRVMSGASAIFAPVGIRVTQFGVLVLLRYNPGIRPSEIAAALGLKRANFVPLLDDLRERGFAETVARSDDRRSRAIYLTPAGMELIVKLEAAVQEYELGVMARIDPDHTGVLGAMVDTLTQLQGERSFCEQKEPKKL